MSQLLSVNQEAEVDIRCHRFLQRAAAIRDRHVITASLELGKAGVEELFDGDFARIHDRSAAQADALSHLMDEHSERMVFLGLDVGRVRACMTAYEVDMHLPPDAQGRLDQGQLRALAGIPSPLDRARLALEAVAEQWSVRTMQDTVTKYRQEEGIVSKGGPKPLPIVVKQAAAVRRATEKMAAPHEAETLPLGAHVKLRQEIEAVEAWVKAWKKLLA